MATSEQQRGYNAKYREKTRKIKALSIQLDRMVQELEALPKCAECHAGGGCEHTKERKRVLLEAEMVRAKLRELEH